LARDARDGRAAVIVRIECADFEAVAGHGVKGFVDGRRITAGTLRLMNMESLVVSEVIVEKGKELYDEAKTLSYVGIDDTVHGIVAFADVLKPS
jgi:Cu+-exporting ATPase